jgi:transposase
MNHSKRSRNGSKYTFELGKIVTDAVGQGLSFEKASKLAGVTRPTIYAWKKKYKGFAARLDQAVAKKEVNLVSLIANASDWRAKAFILERRFPERWSKHKMVQLEETDIESKLSEIQRLALCGIISSKKIKDQIEGEEHE